MQTFGANLSGVSILTNERLVHKGAHIVALPFKMPCRTKVRNMSLASWTQVRQPHMNDSWKKIKTSYACTWSSRMRAPPSKAAFSFLLELGG